MSAFIPPVTKISSRIIRVLGCNPGPMTLQGTNTYLIGTGKRRILLDTGENENKEYTTVLQDVLKEEDVSLDSIVVSHWHHDHIGGLPGLLSTNIVSKGFPVHKLARLDPPDDAIPSEYNSKFLKDGQTLHTDGATLRVVATPGHTQDHLVLYLEEENAILSGDCILGEGTAVFEELYDYMKSLSIILGLKPKVIYPGHGPVIENPVPKIEYYIQHRNQREEQIFNALKASKEPLTAMDIVKQVYTETPEHLHRAAENNVGHHLQKLYKEKKVGRMGEKWAAKASYSSL